MQNVLPEPPGPCRKIGRMGHSSSDSPWVCTKHRPGEHTREKGCYGPRPHLRRFDSRRNCRRDINILGYQPHDQKEITRGRYIVESADKVHHVVDGHHSVRNANRIRSSVRTRTRFGHERCFVTAGKIIRLVGLTKCASPLPRLLSTSDSNNLCDKHKCVI